MPETTTEWGVRSTTTCQLVRYGDKPTAETKVRICSSREDAVRHAELIAGFWPADLYRHDDIAVVRREVTPWEAA